MGYIWKFEEISKNVYYTYQMVANRRHNGNNIMQISVDILHIHIPNVIWISNKL